VRSHTSQYNHKLPLASFVSTTNTYNLFIIVLGVFSLLNELRERKCVASDHSPPSICDCSTRFLHQFRFRKLGFKSKKFHWIPPEFDCFICGGQPVRSILTLKPYNWKFSVRIFLSSLNIKLLGSWERFGSLRCISVQGWPQNEKMWSSDSEKLQFNISLCICETYWYAFWENSTVWTGQVLISYPWEKIFWKKSFLHKVTSIFTRM